ncbi:hypothetical protein O3M35_012544 [Rhynocoris fuscipes]|uniref:Uncharacterized protein n=1 Tax=Rhynocoris fuscipes TaxID=488301 RepID=A0AAW1D030_9HEMI
MDYEKCSELDKEEPPISLGKNLDIEERTLTYFPRALLKLDPEEELRRIQTQTFGKEKGQQAKLCEFYEILLKNSLLLVFTAGTILEII